jgi:hypothetical protein
MIRAFWRAFLQGYRQARRAAATGSDEAERARAMRWLDVFDEAQDRRLMDEAHRWALAENVRRDAMRRYGLTERDRTYQAGREN